MLTNELTGIEKLAEQFAGGICFDDAAIARIGSAADLIHGAWEAAVFSAAPTESLVRYFHYHLEGIRRASDTLYFSRLKPQKGYSSENYRFFQTRLVGLTDHMKDNFGPYFNQRSFAPYAYRDALRYDLQKLYTKVTRSMDKLNISPALKSCLTNYFAAVMQQESNQQYTFSELFYFRDLLTGIDTVIPCIALGGTADLAIAEVLTGMNFNHLAFLGFKIDLISSKLSQMDLSGKLEALRAMLREKKWAPERQTAYDPLWPSLNAMLSGWLCEEITLTQKMVSDRATLSGSSKLPLNLSVAHLACLLRLFYEENLIPNTSLTDLFKFISSGYKTKRQGNISAASLSKEFYSIGQVTAAVTRDLLQNMILRINRNFFPVWAVVYLTVGAFLKK